MSLFLAEIKQCLLIIGAVYSRLETLEKFKRVCFKGAQGDFCARPNYFLHKEMLYFCLMSLK